jgi:hypothetical protein
MMMPLPDGLTILKRRLAASALISASRLVGVGAGAAGVIGTGRLFRFAHGGILSLPLRVAQPSSGPALTGRSALQNSRLSIGARPVLPPAPMEQSGRQGRGWVRRPCVADDASSFCTCERGRACLSRSIFRDFTPTSASGEPATKARQTTRGGLSQAFAGRNAACWVPERGNALRRHERFYGSCWDSSFSTAECRRQWSLC